MKNQGLILLYFLAIFIRLWLMLSPYQSVIADRVEVSTPANSWKRVTEGLHLTKNGINPYEGDLLHETPLHMLFYTKLVEIMGMYLFTFFIICDIITAHLLYLVAKEYMRQLRNEQENNKSNYAKDARDLLLIDEDFLVSPIYVAAAYLFNPYNIFSCVGFTTTVISNLLLSLFYLAMLHRKLFVGTLSLALCAFQTFYAILLLSPLFLCFCKDRKIKGIKTAAALLMPLGFLLLFFGWTYYLTKDLSFLENTYGFLLRAPDLRPNVGLFWYFFIEMFEHFRSLFIYSFQINVCLLYLIPLSIRFRNEPMLLATSLTSMIATFKSYPCLGDVGFVLALLPCWKHLFNYMQQGFVVGCIFLVTTALGPTVWYLWIYSGSANANFYFGVTLAFATAQIFLITDVLFAYTKREFTIKCGHDRKLNGKEAKLVLE